MSEIIAGLDGSAHSLEAVEWAAEEARLRDARLRIVYAVVPWLFHRDVDPRVRGVRDWMLSSGQEVVDEAVALVGKRTPDVPVVADMVPGSPPRALIKAAEGAAMVVVGSHGAGTLTGLLLGSVALQVAAHAPCPAVIVRRLEPPPGREVVVGVDGSDNGRAAIGFAFQEAKLRGIRLRAMLAWPHPAATARAEAQPVVFDPDRVTEQESHVLAESLAGWRERFPDVEVARDVVRGRPVRVLAATSAGADLLVVSTRGRGGFTGLMLGSVSHALLHHARCPLAVVPPAAAPGRTG
jgi:nucleotide-binding universal stress UspA family protein